MKKLLLIVGLLSLSVNSYAQLPERFESLTNPLVVAGLNRLDEKPTDGTNQFRFFITANIAGFKPISGVPLYLAGIGVDIRTMPGLGSVDETNGAGLSVPLVTYAFSEGQIVAQVGYSMAFGEAQTSGVYAGVGFSITSPTQLKVKREKTKAEKAKKSTENGPPESVSYIGS